MKIAIIDILHDALRQQLEAAGHRCIDYSTTSGDELTPLLAKVDGIAIRSKMPITSAMIDQWPRLQFIGRVGAGLEHIDVEYARSKGIQVFSSPEGNRQAVAEHALGMLLSLMNHISKADREVRNGSWLRKENEGEELSGKTVAAIGHGNTGSAFTRLLSGFGVRVIAHDKYLTGFGTEQVEEVEMEEVYDTADVVSLHLPMTDETNFLVNAAWWGKFKKPIYLVNTSRGRIIHTNDLLQALDDGKVKGACLDVLEYETEKLKMPPKKNLPATAHRLHDHSRVLLTPHIAGITAQSYEKLSSIMAQKIIDHFGRA